LPLSYSVDTAIRPNSGQLNNSSALFLGVSRLLGTCVTLRKDRTPSHPVRYPAKMTIVRANGRLCSKALRDIISPCLPRIPARPFNSIQISQFGGELSPDHRRLVLQAAGPDAQIVSSRLRSPQKYPVGFLLLQVGKRDARSRRFSTAFRLISIKLATAAASSGVQVGNGRRFVRRLRCHPQPL